MNHGDVYISRVRLHNKNKSQSDETFYLFFTGRARNSSYWRVYTKWSWMVFFLSGVGYFFDHQVWLKQPRFQIRQNPGTRPPSWHDAIPTLNAKISPSGNLYVCNTHNQQIISRQPSRC